MAEVGDLILPEVTEATEPAVSPAEGPPSRLIQGTARLDGEELHAADVEQALASFGYVGGDE
jgi:hypothetical protein